MNTEEEEYLFLRYFMICVVAIYHFGINGINRHFAFVPEWSAISYIT